MRGHLAAEQFKSWKKPEVEALAKDIGVSADGTKDEIIARICEVEVEVPDEKELTPEEVKTVREAEKEAAAKETAAAAAGKVAIKCVTRFRDLQHNRHIREVGEEWDEEPGRAAFLIEKKYAEPV